MKELARGPVPAAVAAAVGEAAALFVPITIVAREMLGLRAGPFVSLPLFLALAAAAVAVATAARRSAVMPTATAVGAVTLGVVSVALWREGGADVLALAGAVTLSLLLALRAVTLGLRDWRNPIAASFGVVAVLALAVTLMAGTRDDRYTWLLAAGIAVFFLGSLASRGASVRLATGVRGRSAEGAGRRARLAIAAVAALAVFLGLAVALGQQAGLLEGFTRLMAPVLSFIVFLFVQAVRPILWLASKFHVNLEGVQRFLRNLRPDADADLRRHQPGGGIGTFQRLLGLAVLILLAFLIVRAIRRRLARSRDGGPAETFGTEPEDEELVARPLPRAPRPKPARAARRELPDDAVRRWYAESLLDLERRGLERSAWQTPAELLANVRAELPSSGAPLAELTRAYEDVRYGNRSLPKADLRRARRARAELVRILRA